VRPEATLSRMRRSSTTEHVCCAKMDSNYGTFAAELLRKPNSRYDTDRSSQGRLATARR
jgi:hypothetical protein